MCRKERLSRYSSALGGGAVQPSHRRGVHKLVGFYRRHVRLVRRVVAVREERKSRVSCPSCAPTTGPKVVSIAVVGRASSGPTMAEGVLPADAVAVALVQLVVQQQLVVGVVRHHAGVVVVEDVVRLEQLVGIHLGGIL